MNYYLQFALVPFVVVIVMSVYFYFFKGESGKQYSIEMLKVFLKYSILIGIMYSIIWVISQ